MIANLFDRPRRVVVLALAACALLVVAGCSDDKNSASSGSPASASSSVPAGVTRTPLGQATPTNAPGQQLYLQQVTIGPKSQLPQHFHQGTQVARVMSGDLTYNIVSGTATITRADGKTEQPSGPSTVHLLAGDSIVETESLVHYGANDTNDPVVIELAALLLDGAPLATPEGTATPGTPLHLTANLDSPDRSLHMVGPNNSITYGWNHLVGDANVDGQPVGVDLQGAVNYVSGNGPFSGFVTYSFADGSTLAVTMQGATTAAADGSSANFIATLGVIGGTGQYATAKGTGTFTGTRNAMLGSTVAATFDLQVQT